jgi:predicted nuclease of predicted toxin-antitoxin system
LDLPERNKTKDSQIAKLANTEGRIVISKDIDFLESFMIKSVPQKLIIVTTGNIVNKHLLKIFEDNLELILFLISSSNLIEVSKTEIIEQK